MEKKDTTKKRKYNKQQKCIVDAKVVMKLQEELDTYKGFVEWVFLSLKEKQLIMKMCTGVDFEREIAQGLEDLFEYYHKTKVTDVEQAKQITILTHERIYKQGKKEEDKLEQEIDDIQDERLVTNFQIRNSLLQKLNPFAYLKLHRLNKKHKQTVQKLEQCRIKVDELGIYIESLKKI